MKIAISSAGSTLSSNVARQLGTAEYMMIIDLDTGDVEAVSNPGKGQQRGAGIQAVMLAISNGADTVLTGYCNPAISRQFETGGIEIVTGISGTVAETIQNFKDILPKETDANLDRSAGEAPKTDKKKYINAARSALRQLINILPVMFSIVLLIGLFNTLISKKILAGIFSGNPLIDNFLGACFGSIFTTNPINSYIIGGELLKHGVSLVAVTSFVIAWVTVGLIQLPAEMTALGRRFAVLRNFLSFLSAIIVAFLTVSVLNLTGIVS